MASAPLVFSSPTRQPLAAALNEVSASSKGRQIALVLHHRGDERLATLSATQPGASGKEMFLPGQAPTPAPLVPAFGQPPGVTSDEPQGAALVRFADRRGTVTVQLRRLVWRATLGASCDDVQVDVHALLPISQLGLTLHLAGGDKTIAELLGVALADGDADEAPSGPALPGASISRPQPEALHFAFKAAPAAFDHGSH